MRQTIAEVIPLLEAAVAQSSLDFEELHQLSGPIASTYANEGQVLDDVDDAWSWGKLEDAADAAKRARYLGFRLQTSWQLRRLLQFIAFGADIGRLIVRNRCYPDNAENRRQQAFHGADSADYLDQIMGRPQDALWKSMMVAVTRHSDPRSPTLEDLGGDEVTYYLCLLLRDLDKVGNWVGSGAQYVTPQKIRAESFTNDVVDEPYARDVIVEIFERGEPIDRNLCETYIEYMAQFLGWGFDFGFDEMWQEVVESNQPQLVLAWIKKRLHEGGNEATWRRIEIAAKEKLNLEAA